MILRSAVRAACLASVLGVDNVLDAEPPPGTRTGRFYYGGLKVSF
jgi:hypothetical protein